MTVKFVLPIEFYVSASALILKLSRTRRALNGIFAHPNRKTTV